MLIAYWIEQHHPLVHNLQVLRHQPKIVLKLIAQLLHPLLLYLNHKTIISLNVLTRYYQVIVLRHKYLHKVHPIPQLLLPRVQVLLLLQLTIVLLTRVPLLLVQWHASHCTPLLLYYVVWGTRVVIRLRVINLLLLFKQVRIFTDIFQYFFPLLSLLHPLAHIITWLLVLESP